MNLHTRQGGSSPCPQWARVAAWFALVILLAGSVVGAAHIHQLPCSHISHGSHTSASATPDDGSTCLLCTLHDSAVPAQTLRSDPVLRHSEPAPQLYTSRSVPAELGFALSNRPPPAA